ncbi:potassium channel family protein [Halorhabdus rudnickae]|uniref:potassium channel family protein n=1 Tax=Halorhabdus rudnickae TaxID=1775544 RepID=UPI0010833628|nr:TrkA family potassium uptake protein [Halorhabdus rudnickae]
MTQDLNVTIAGGGRVGFKTAEILAEQGHDVTIVEDDDDRCEAIADAWIATVITGDATDPGILTQASIESTDVVAGLTGKTGVNLAVCMMARELSPDVRTVARVDTDSVDRYTQFVDAIVYPEQAGARVAANEIRGSDVQTLADVTGALDIMEIRVADDAPVAGKTLEEIRFPEGTLVISDDDGDRVARPETTLSPGKRYVVATEPDVAEEITRLFRG